MMEKLHKVMRMKWSKSELKSNNHLLVLALLTLSSLHTIVYNAAIYPWSTSRTLYVVRHWICPFVTASLLYSSVLHLHKSRLYQQGDSSSKTQRNWVASLHLQRGPEDAGRIFGTSPIVSSALFSDNSVLSALVKGVQPGANCTSSTDTAVWVELWDTLSNLQFICIWWSPWMTSFRSALFCQSCFVKEDSATA